MKRDPRHPARLKFVAMFVALASATFTAAIAQAASFSVFATVNNVYQEIGTLDANIVDYGAAQGRKVEEGLFQLNNDNKYLMDDPCCQFRWFQIVTEDTAPINYLGNPLTAPYVDPPKDGWDYERTPANDHANGAPGADSSPFYEEDDTYAGNTPYGKYSDNLNSFGGANNPAPIHDAATGTARTQDNPGTSPGESVSFMTFITFMNCDMAGNKEFIIIAGYEWSMSRDNAGDFSYTGPSSIDLSIDGLSDTLSSALGADGFGDWSFVINGYGNDNIVCPEPTSFALIGLGGFVLARRRRAA